MIRASNGFIMLEVIAAVIIISAGVLGIAACYSCGVGLMLRHNYKQEAFTLAQKNMAVLRGNVLSGQMEKAQGRFRIRGGQQVKGSSNPYTLLFVEVYLEKETTPLVNLVSYE